MQEGFLRHSNGFFVPIFPKRPIGKRVSLRTESSSLWGVFLYRLILRANGEKLDDKEPVFFG